MKRLFIDDHHKRGFPLWIEECDRLELCVEQHRKIEPPLLGKRADIPLGFGLIHGNAEHDEAGILMLSIVVPQLHQLDFTRFTPRRKKAQDHHLLFQVIGEDMGFAFDVL